MRHAALLAVLVVGAALSGCTDSAHPFEQSPERPRALTGMGWSASSEGTESWLPDAVKAEASVEYFFPPCRNAPPTSFGCSGAGIPSCERAGGEDWLCRLGVRLVASAECGLLECGLVAPYEFDQYSGELSCPPTPGGCRREISFIVTPTLTAPPRSGQGNQAEVKYEGTLDATADVKYAGTTVRETTAHHAFDSSISLHFA